MRIVLAVQQDNSGVNLILVKQERVSVNWQTLFCILPYIWIYAFYRIEKLRLGIVIAIDLAHSTAPEDLMHPEIKSPYPFISDCNISAIIALYDGKVDDKVVCEK